MDIVNIIRDSGIVGAGGAGFPTHIKLKKNIDYYIINACECEPFLEVDKFLLRNYSKEIIKTIDKIADFLEANNVCIAIKKTYVEEMNILNNIIKENNSRIYLYEMDPFYPAGDEHLIIYEITKKPLAERAIPLDNCSLVNNVGTIFNIYNAVFNSEKLTHKFISIAGEVKKPLICKVPVGTPVRYILNNIDISCDSYGIIMGGPMMGKYYDNDDEINNLFISKRSTGIIILSKNHYLFSRINLSIDKLKSTTKNDCIQCRFCTDYCPRYMLGHNIRPHHIMRNLSLETEFKTEQEYIDAFGDAINCSECGICELFACPMLISPRQVNQYVKSKIREKGINIPRKLDPVVHKDYNYIKINTDRLISRLKLSKYKIEDKIDDFIELNPDYVSISLLQHMGKPSVACVNVGDFVKQGQLIAYSDGEFSINIHSSLTGKVVNIENEILISRR